MASARGKKGASPKTETVVDANRPSAVPAAPGRARARGRVGVHPRGFGFVQLEPEAEGASAFVAPPELNAFVEGDLVTAAIEESAPGRLSASKLELVERVRRELFGVVVTRSGRAYLRVDREVANTDWAFVDLDAPPPEGAFVVAAIEGARLRPIRVVSAADASLERVVVRHGLRTEYPAAALVEARMAVERGPEPLAARRDLRAVPTVTIDAESTRDIDDALAVLPAAPDGALRLLVSIADVDALVSEGSALDREARTRGTSVYLAGRVIPMIPPALSEDALSLLPGVDRPAMTVELRIDPEGRVTAVDVYPSLIRSWARLDYDGVAAFLDRGESAAIPEDVRSTVRWLRTAAARIAVTRASRGGVSLARDEAYITLDAQTREPTALSARITTTAHVLVERLMVAANEAVATWLVDRGLPGVFRVHDAPEPRSVAELARYAHNFGVEPGFGSTLSPLGLAAFEAQVATTTIADAMRSVLGRVLGPARYTVHPSLHFGLAAQRYLHFTSPIRRYADLAVHRIVKAFLAGRRDLHAGDVALQELAEHLNGSALRADKAERERLRMLAARLFASRIGETFAGNVVMVQPFGLIVQLEGTAVTGTVGTDALPGGPWALDHARHALVGESTTWSIGDPIDVEIVATNEDLGRIELVQRGARPEGYPAA